MQAPILSFDEEGDIPLPATKNKRMNFYNVEISSNIYILGFLSPDRTFDSPDTLSATKSGGDSVSIERTRKEKFRHALRSISKVAFSQLGLGK